MTDAEIRLRKEMLERVLLITSLMGANCVEFDTNISTWRDRLSIPSSAI